MNIAVRKKAEPSPPAGLENPPADSSARGGRGEAAALSVLGLLFLALYFPLIFAGKTFFFRDVTHFAMPMKLFTVQSFARGELPLWWPNVLGGAPFLGLMHPGVFYPLNLIFFLTADFVTGYNAYFMVHTLILVFTVYALCRTWRLTVEASFCSAATALFGGYFLSVSSIYSHFAAAAWSPLLLLAFDRFLRRGQARYFFLAVAALALQVLAGAPEVWILSAMLCYFYALVMVPERSSAIPGWRGKTLAMGGVGVFALGLGAVQVAPTHYLMQMLARNILGFPFETAARWSAGPDVLSSLVLPDKFNEAMVRVGYQLDFYLQNYYLGLFPLVVLLAVVLGVFKSRAALFWSSVFLAGLFFGLGKYNPAYEWMYKWVPLLGKFRYPEKFLFLSSVAGVFLTGYGFDALMKKDENGKRWAIILIIVAALAALAAGVYYIKPERHLVETLVILASLGFAFLAWEKTILRASLFKTLVLILICLDLVLKNFSTIPMIDREFIDEVPSQVAMMDTSSPYRVYSGIWSTEHYVKGEAYYGQLNLVMTYLGIKHSLSGNMGTLYGISYFNGLTGLKLFDSLAGENLFKELNDEQKKSVLAKSNVKYIVSLVDEVKSTDDNPLGEMEMEELADAMPRAYLVGRASFAPYPRVARKFYESSFDSRKEVLLSTYVPWNKAENFEGEVLDLDHTPNRVTLRTRQNGEGFLVLLDSYFPGWTVRVDGEEEKIYRGNYFYRAVKLGPGEHTVEFTYMPLGLKLGCAVSIGALAVLVCITGAGPVRRRIFPA